MFYSSRVHHTLQVKCVVLYIRGIIQDRQGTERGTSRCNVHLCLWTFEAIADIVWFEALRDVFGDAVLRQHDQSRCLLEGPRKKRIEVSFHHGQEEGEVSSSTSTVPVQVDPETDLVPVSGGVEGGTVQGHSHAQRSLSPPPGQIGDLPNVDWPVAGGLDGLDVQGYVAVVVLEFFDGSLDFNNGIFRGYSSGTRLRLHSLHLGHVVSQLPGQL